MKRFFSCIDARLLVPQPIQHLAIRDKAQKAGGVVIFYGAEEIKALKFQPFIKTKLHRLHQAGELDGVVFFTVHQFRYGPAFNFDLLRHVLDMNLELHFAREGLSFLKPSDLDALFPLLLSADYTERRDSSEEWKSLVACLDLSSIPSATL